MKKPRQENERLVRTFCACADVLLRDSKPYDAARYWEIGHNPVSKALSRLTKESLQNIPDAMIVVSAALNEADKENAVASRKSEQKKKMLSLADSLGYAVVKKTNQTTLF